MMESSVGRAESSMPLSLGGRGTEFLYSNGPSGGNFFTSDILQSNWPYDCPYIIPMLL